jgi:hypothetical protein
MSLTECGKRKLRKHKTVLRTLAEKLVLLTRKKKTIVKRGGFLLPQLGSVDGSSVSAVQTYRQIKYTQMRLRKMYLVSPDHFQKGGMSSPPTAHGQPSHKPKQKI